MTCKAAYTERRVERVYNTRQGGTPEHITGDTITLTIEHIEARTA